MQTKADYLHILLVSKAVGLTTKEAVKFFKEDVSRDAAGNILRRLYKQRCVAREKDGLEWRYFITMNGIKKLAHLRQKQRDTS